MQLAQIGGAVLLAPSHEARRVSGFNDRRCIAVPAAGDGHEENIFKGMRDMSTICMSTIKDESIKQQSSKGQDSM